MHAANHLDAALPAVEERVQVPGRFAEIFDEARKEMLLRAPSGNGEFLEMKMGSEAGPERL